MVNMTRSQLDKLIDERIEFKLTELVAEERGRYSTKWKRGKGPQTKKFAISLPIELAERLEALPKPLSRHIARALEIYLKAWETAERIDAED